MKLIVICYHYIYSDENHFIKRGVRIEQFREHLEYLKKYYLITHFSDLPNLDTKRDICIITFDDGLKECYTQIFPILKDTNTKAVFFICSRVYQEKVVLSVQKSHILSFKLGDDNFRKQFYNILDGQHKRIIREKVSGINYKEIYPYDSDVNREFKLDLNYRLPIESVENILKTLFRQTFGSLERDISEQIYLTEDQLKEMNRSNLIELGAHTHSHYLLSRLSKEDQIREIRLSIDYLKNELGSLTPIPFSYPFGRKGTYNQITKDILSNDVRIGWACNMQRKYNETLQDRLDINRFDEKDIFSKEFQIVS